MIPHTGLRGFPTPRATSFPHLFADLIAIAMFSPTAVIHQQRGEGWRGLSRGQQYVKFQRELAFVFGVLADNVFPRNAALDELLKVVMSVLFDLSNSKCDISTCYDKYC